MLIIGVNHAINVNLWHSRILKPDVRKAMLAFDVFEKWGIDAVGPLPVTQRGKWYILTAVDYLSLG